MNLVGLLHDSAALRVQLPTQVGVVESDAERFGQVVDREVGDLNTGRVGCPGGGRAHSGCGGRCHGDDDRTGQDADNVLAHGCS